MSDDPVIRCTGLTKTYRDFWGRQAFPALQGVDLAIPRGASHALLGPNGSGKTTTLRILLGLLQPTGGEVALFGRAPSHSSVRARLGFLPEQSSLHGFLKARETLEIFGRLHGLNRADRRRRAEELLAAVSLTDAATKRVRELSHGMRRRLALAVALVSAPELLILDEPTAGMDPLVREGILGLLKAHVEGGGTLLVTSHLLGDIRGIASQATLLARGKVVREGNLDDLLARPGEQTYRVRADDQVDAALRNAVSEAGGEVLEGGPSRATIEDLFLDTYRADESEA